MIDVIIPAYNAHDTIKRTLYSISIQKNIDFKVYIINDCSKYDYSKEVNFFKNFMSIKELKLDKNSGPGVAREHGINNSNSDYIVFIDADDYLYYPNSLYDLYTAITNNNSDLVISNFIYERDNEIVIKKKNNVWLHGKIYKRKFLNDNDIHFNDTYSNEDNGFNRLIFLHQPKVSYLDIETYVYSENSNSITRRNNRAHKFDGLEWYCYNINWAIEQVIKKGHITDDIVYSALGVLVSMYYYYLEFYEINDVSLILKWSKNIKIIYDKYKGDLINFNLVNIFLRNKEEEYTNIVKRLSFYEFLELI